MNRFQSWGASTQKNSPCLVKCSAMPYDQPSACDRSFLIVQPFRAAHSRRNRKLLANSALSRRNVAVVAIIAGCAVSARIAASAAPGNSCPRRKTEDHQQYGQKVQFHGDLPGFELFKRLRQRETKIGELGLSG